MSQFVSAALQLVTLDMTWSEAAGLKPQIHQLSTVCCWTCARTETVIPEILSWVRWHERPAIESLATAKNFTTDLITRSATQRFKPLDRWATQEILHPINANKSEASVTCIFNNIDTHFIKLALLDWMTTTAKNVEQVSQLSARLPLISTLAIANDITSGFFPTQSTTLFKSTASREPNTHTVIALLRVIVSEHTYMKSQYSTRILVIVQIFISTDKQTSRPLVGTKIIEQAPTTAGPLMIQQRIHKLCSDLVLVHFTHRIATIF